MLESFYKRLFVLGIVLGFMCYAAVIALAPWVLIIGFLFFRK